MSENKELIDRAVCILDKVVDFLKKVVTKQTITDKGALYHAGELKEGSECYHDEDMAIRAFDDIYTDSQGRQIVVKGCNVQSISKPQ